ncbi:hypothetical protein ACKI1I_13520 [Streptomyces turgidiscabies]|uniref:hypothetical protein n=1 Tax=Streptomyces turgidiscabies TaxID=85558 RepID=UPI00131A2B3A|nr:MULTISPECIES: hypothetical protein [Streptomyces]MDX3494916.1 hypothetical protein [Streptomyces turgidiscabies]
MDDFALRGRHHHATIITDAETGRRVAVLPDREAETLASWLREHPGIEIETSYGLRPEGRDLGSRRGPGAGTRLTPRACPTALTAGRAADLERAPWRRRWR